MIRKMWDISRNTEYRSYLTSCELFKTESLRGNKKYRLYKNHIPSQIIKYFISHVINHFCIIISYSFFRYKCVKTKMSFWRLRVIRSSQCVIKRLLNGWYPLHLQANIEDVLFYFSVYQLLTLFSVGDLVSEENPIQLNSSEPGILNTTSVCPECPENVTCVSFCPTSCDCNGTTYLCKTYFSLAYSFLVRMSEVTCNILDVSEFGRGIFQFEIFSSLISTLNITDDVQIEKLIIKDSTIDSIQIPHQVVNHVQFTNIKVHSLSFVTSFMYLHVMGNIPSFSASAFLYMPYVKFEGNDLSTATVIYEMWHRALLSSNNSHNKAVLRNCNIQHTYTTNYVKSSFIDLSHNKLKSFTVSDRTQILLICHNLLDTVVRPLTVTFNTSLKTLDMSFNKITMLGQGDFTYFFNLLYIDLKFNNISWMHDEIFFELTNLRYLDLSNNLIQTIKQAHFINLESLQYLYLQKNLLSSIGLESFYSLKNLIVLDMSNNKLTSLKGMYFRNLKELRYLYLQNNKFQVSEGMFDGLSSLQVIQVDFFSLCCAKPRNVYDIVCIAPGNEISSCSNLIAVPILNVGIWYIALFAAFGNLVVFCYKLVYQKRQSAQAHFIFTTNLNWADFIMGIYLFIIAIANLVYNGRYGLEDFAWRNSYYCTFAGILATVSSETSALLVFLITMDRLIAIKFPFSGRGFTKNGAIFLSLCSWFVALFLALLPIVPMQSNYFDGYYARSGVCISLPLSVVKKSGWQYSMAVFIGLNFLLFVGILIGQIIIFAEVIKVGSNLVSSRKKQREISLTKSLAAIVLTDMCCWIPIGTIGLWSPSNEDLFNFVPAMFYVLNLIGTLANCLVLVAGLLTFFGIDVTNEVYDWIIVIVLPINSALNPVIYNFIAFMRHKVCCSFISVFIYLQSCLSRDNNIFLSLAKSWCIRVKQLEAGVCRSKT